MPYQRKPIEYDYIQYDGTNADAVQEFVDKYPSTYNYGDSVFKRLSGNTLVVAQNATSTPHVAVLQEGYYLVVRTTPWWREVNDGPGDWSGWFVQNNVDQLEATASSE